MLNRSRNRSRDHGHCRRRGCQCTHDYPCFHGWIESPWTDPDTMITYERVMPCPVCRPEAAARLATTIERTSRDALV